MISRACRFLVASAVLVTAGCATVPSRGPIKRVDIPVRPPRLDLVTLLEHLSSPDAAIRADAAWQFAGATAPLDELRPALLKAAEDSNRAVRYGARWSLDHLEPRRSTAEDRIPPQLVRRATPEMPYGAFLQQIQGTVEIETLIGEEGEIARAEVRKSIPELDAAALECVRRMRFTPARQNGQPIATVVETPVTFQLI
jgi:TonB family protein